MSLENIDFMKNQLDTAEPTRSTQSKVSIPAQYLKSMLITTDAKRRITETISTPEIQHPCPNPQASFCAFSTISNSQGVSTCRVPSDTT